MGILIGATPTRCSEKPEEKASGGLDDRYQDSESPGFEGLEPWLSPSKTPSIQISEAISSEIVPVSGGGEDQMQCEAFSTVPNT